MGVLAARVISVHKSKGVVQTVNRSMFEGILREFFSNAAQIIVMGNSSQSYNYF